MRNLIGFLITVLFTLFTSAFNPTWAQNPRDDEAYKKGETLFKGNCTSCHKVADKLVGPALAKVYDKYDRAWLYKWVKNSQAVVKSGDAQATAIFNEYNKSVMTAFPNFTDGDIDNILQYIKVETENPAAAAPTAAAGGGQVAESTSNPVLIFLGVITALLLAISFILSRVNTTLGNVLKEKMGHLIPDGFGINKQLFNTKTLTLLILGCTIFLGYKMVEGAQYLGRQQNYQPTQPIKFSHKLHAGTNQIQCQYCHVGVTKGKSAIIPSASLCMNCHKAIKKGPEYGETEIAKIYKAVGWDPNANKYIDGYKEQNIEWIRIHNLPDHVYFNHSQHVKAGGVACQTCHGNVQEMDVVKQHSTLGMGWCINCHRQTEVKFKENGFYQSYEVLHNKLKDGRMTKVTVDDIGGTECQKCHY